MRYGADPWAMSGKELHNLGANPVPFRRMTEKEVGEFCARPTLAPVYTIEDGELFASICDRPFYPQDLYMPKIDNGRYVFTFRIYEGGLAEVVKEAETFNQKPHAINVFPTGEKDNVYESIALQGEVVMPVRKALDDGSTLIRLYNPENEPKQATLAVGKAKRK